MRSIFADNGTNHVVQVTLPQANQVNALRGNKIEFDRTWWCRIANEGTAALVITPTTSTIDGLTSITLRQYEGTTIVSDGANYHTTGHPSRAFKGDLTPPALTGGVNDYCPVGLEAAFTLRIDGGASSRTITGLASGIDGRAVRIVNIGANNLVLINSSASSTAANRFAFTSDWRLAPNQVAVLQYDATSARWRPFQGGP